MITLQETKTYLGVEGDDLMLSSIISRAEAALTSLIGDISLRTVQDFYFGTGSQYLILCGNISFPNYGTDSWVKIGRESPTTLEERSIETEGAVLIYLDGIFPKGIKNIEVKYQTGYAETPGDIKEALLNYVGHIYSGAGKEGITSEKIGDFSMSYGKESEKDFFSKILNTYGSIL